ncbi:MAG TPA: cobalamin biosynthesis protein CbiX [Verrucomicrobiales bacterium]|nr:cobalamin biosynthesis protein CbiX [Verrucomicrobiales bacterium]
MLTFPDNSLIVLGHGSTVNDDSAAPVFQHAAELRRRGLFGEVREAFWKQEPKLAAVLASAACPRVVVVPLFISEGYFTEEAIPEALGLKRPGESAWSRHGKVDGRVLHLTPPVGSDPSMTGLLLHRAAEVIELFPFPARPRTTDISLFIAGHGTERNRRSREAVEHQVALVREMDLYADVRPCFIEEEPLIKGVPAAATTRNVVVAPFFIADGLHVAEDIPLMLGEPEPVVRKRLAAGQPAWRNPTERNGRRIWVAQAIGTDPGMTGLILNRAREALAGAAGE